MRYLYLIGGILFAVLAGIVAVRAVADPMNAQRQFLAQELSNLPPPTPMDSASDRSPEWQREILEKPGLWRQLIPPPPAPPAPPPAPPKPPNMEEMLTGVRALTRGTASTVYMVWPGNENGGWVSVGDTVQGCVVKEFDRTSVTFSYLWSQSNTEFTYKIPRERRLN